MPAPTRFGGVIHTYQKYDPAKFPSPTQEPPDLVSTAFEHMLHYGSMRELTDEELARAIRIDPSQIAGLGPSLEALREMLEERKRKILETYETDGVLKEAQRRYRQAGERMKPPGAMKKQFNRAFEEEQIHDLERLWYRADHDRSDFARQIVQLVDRLGDKYQVDELAVKNLFPGREPLTVPQALEIKEELEAIDRLLKQLEEAEKTAQIGVIDLEELSRFAESADIGQLEQFRQQLEEYARNLAESQGLDRSPDGRYHLTPKAYKLFQGRLLESIFSQLQASRTGRHAGPIVGEGAVELQRTKPYEFGDSVTQMDIPASMTNALLRGGPGLPVRMKPEDIEIHRTRNTPKCATVVLMDMSGSMRYAGQYVNVKRMALALDGLIRSEYPGDFLQFVEMYTFAKPRRSNEIAGLMWKEPTIGNPVVRLRADMSDPNITEMQVPQHFTNIQHSLRTARRFLAAQDTPNKQVILITDGLPTAHFEGSMLYLLYPPDPATEAATMREGQHCRREGITINIFLIPSWSQSHEDIQFAHRLAQSTTGRVFFTAGRDLDRYVVWDYVERKRQIIS
jgi:uncharacterized protein with von Willebrand factor type A (vWA) domain